MKLTVWRVLAFLLLIALSVGFGFAFDATATAIEKHRYPRPEELSEAVARESAAHAIPEAVIWATMHSGSNFASNAVSPEGRIGLMQITPERFDAIREELLGLDATDAGLLYDPATNLSAACAWLSHLYEHYGVWDLVYAAYHVGTEAVDAWLSDPALTDEAGVLVRIPDPDAADYTARMKKTVSYYESLYYQSQRR